jgi:hypothetical protein
VVQEGGACLFKNKTENHFSPRLQLALSVLGSNHVDISAVSKFE